MSPEILDQSESPVIRDLSDEKKMEIEKFLTTRFTHLRDLRRQLDNEIIEEVKIFNNIDEDIDDLKETYESKVKIPYVYTIVHTMVARILASLFPSKNYIRTFIERDKLLDIEDTINQWLQEELDKLKLKKRARDFIEEAVTKRLSWIQLRPLTEKREGGKSFRIGLDIYNVFDVWFDTKALDVMDTDIFARKLKKLWVIKANKDYFNLDRVSHWNSKEDDDSYRRDEYKFKHSGGDSRPEYQDNLSVNYITDEVEILEWYGLYDMNPDSVTDNENEDYEPDMQEVIFTMANRTVFIGAQKNTIETKKKRLFFPIRPLKQASSLFGKSAPQLVKDIAKNMNQVASLRMDNFNLLIKLLFRYNRDADIDLDELFAAGGNAVGYTGDKNTSIDTFDIPNLVREATLMMNEDVNIMQQTTGAVDYVQGQSPKGEQTASEVRTGTEQALFKFSMMAENCYDDLMEVVNYVIILQYLYNEAAAIERHNELLKFFAEIKKIEDLEESYIFDIELKDISQRRDIERHQWANAMGVIAPIISEIGGNVQELFKQFFIAFQIPNADKILQPEAPEAMAAKLARNPQLMQQVMTIVAQKVKQEQEGKGGRPPATAVPGTGTIEQAQEGAAKGAGGGAG